MRRRLVLLSVAVTSMVALSFLIPLMGLVGELAHDRAMNQAEGSAERLASSVALLVPANRQDVESLVVAERGEGTETSVIFPDGTVVGAPIPADALLATARGQTSTARYVIEGGEVLYIPVSEGGGRTTLVRVFVSESLLTANVTSARVILLLLGMTLVGIAVVVADRFAGSIAAPVLALADGAHRLGEGELGARVEPAGPPEVEEVGRAFNRLADQVGRLLEVERESVADLSHRLRTPLTAARLDVDAVADPVVAERLRDDIDELERTVDYVIREARRPMRQGAGVIADLVDVVRERVRFWGALADEQDRNWSLSLPEGTRMVAGSAIDFGAALDSLLGNVFAHTADGVAFDVLLRDEPGGVVLTVSDEGEGFGEEAIERGWSGGDSSGLGLDIVRRTIEDAGGKMAIEAGRGGHIVLHLPLAE